MTASGTTAQQGYVAAEIAATARVRSDRRPHRLLYRACFPTNRKSTSSPSLRRGYDVVSHVVMIPKAVRICWPCGSHPGATSAGRQAGARLLRGSGPTSPPPCLTAITPCSTTTPPTTDRARSPPIGTALPDTSPGGPGPPSLLLALRRSTTSHSEPQSTAADAVSTRSKCPRSPDPENGEVQIGTCPSPAAVSSRPVAVARKSAPPSIGRRHAAIVPLTSALAGHCTGSAAAIRSGDEHLVEFEPDAVDVGLEHRASKP